MKSFPVSVMASAVCATGNAFKEDAESLLEDPTPGHVRRQNFNSLAVKRNEPASSPYAVADLQIKSFTITVTIRAFINTFCAFPRRVKAKRGWAM